MSCMWFAVPSAGSTRRCRVFFELPQLRKEDKLQVVDRAFGDRVGRPVQGLLHVLVEKRRESLLDTIVTEFDAARRRARRAGPGERHHRPRAQRRARRIRSASALERQTQRQVVLHQSVDPSLIGGFRVRLGDLVVDGTLSRALSDMRRALTSSLA